MKGKEELTLQTRPGATLGTHNGCDQCNTHWGQLGQVATLIPDLSDIGKCAPA